MLYWTGYPLIIITYLQKLREDLESKLSISLASMEQELRKCVFDERGTGLVYLQNVPVDEQVRFTILIFLDVNIIIGYLN